MRLYKTPYEIRNFSEDFAAKAGTGTVLTLVSVTSTNAATGADTTSTIIASSALSGQKVIGSLKAGAQGEKHQILVKVTTDAGESLQGDLLLLIVSPKFAELQSALDSRIQDTAGKLSQNDRDDCVWEAITGRYSAARAVKVISDFIGDGVVFSWDIDETNFPGWVQNYSVITAVEYPQGDQEPSMLDPDEWKIYLKGDNAVQFRLTGNATIGGAIPAAGKVVRVTYTVPHAEDGSDIPAVEFYGVADLAASLACSRLAAIYMQSGDAQFGGDAVDYRGRPLNYRQLATDFMKAFQAAFGLDKDAPQPAASGTAQWRIDLETGSKRLMH